MTQNAQSDAERRVKAVWPDAFAWQDEEGHWYISLPHLGESQDDERMAISDQREEAAWLDAASRLSERKEQK